MVLNALLHNKTHVIAAFIIAIVATACGRGPQPDPELYGTPANPEPLELILADRANNKYEAHLPEAPDIGCVKMHINNIGPLRRVFNDSNYVHLEAARALGIKPLHQPSDAWTVSRPLVHITSCPEYFVDELNHSHPYLVPEAAKLLHDIGSAFNDSLRARGGGDYRMKVTSVLRTPASVKRLRRVNVNASNESAHTFATTFDISYSKFICDSISVARSFEDLKNLLAEVLYEFRRQGRCYVKFEYKQSCFHVTVRPDQQHPHNDNV